MPRVAVGRVGEIGPGERKLVSHKDSSIGVFNVDGNLVAYRGYCPHHGAPVCQGRVAGRGWWSEVVRNGLKRINSGASLGNSNPGSRV